MLTVRELIADLDVKLVAGEAGLEAPIRWVHITELSDPTPWLSGGELLLTTGMSLKSARDQRAFVRRLTNRNLAGLGFGTGFDHKQIPKALAEEAEARDFPLFEVPYEVPFIAVTEKAFARLVNEQYAVLQRSISAHERLDRLLLEERGLQAIVSALSTLVGCAVLVFDSRGELLAESLFRREVSQAARASLREELEARLESKGMHGFAPGHPELSGRALALPVAGTGTSAPAQGRGRPGPTPHAWLVAAKDAGGFSEFDRLALHQAVPVIALELLRRRVVADTERRLAGDVLSQLVSGELEGPELERRLDPFGLGESAAVLAFGAPSKRAAEVEEALDGLLRGEARNVLLARHEQLVCAVVGGLRDEQETFDLAARVQKALVDPQGVPVRCGAGRPGPAGQVRRSFHEARCALEAQVLANGAAATGVATYRDLGSFQLLLSLQDSESLRLFCESVLGPIERKEGTYGGELMRSLEAFVEENGQWERAARRLYCHRHTLRYRMRKIEELTGRDLSSARDRIEFWLALRSRELLPGGK